MSDFDSQHQSFLAHISETDPAFQQQVQRLYRLTLYGRWIFVAGLWLILLPLSLWGLRHEIPLWVDYFTWTALRYSLLYNPVPAFGLILCFSTTLSVLLWQICNALFGVSPHYKRRLEKQLLRIRQQGESHPLWKWVCAAKG